MMILATCESTIAHCGYDLSFFFVDGKEHSYHHAHADSMYGSFLMLFDKIMGTDKQYKNYLSKLKAKKS
jgi:sterol desaturase/sphingolipid hydroxylase (fatty acid hydroxylase superfamily)